MNPTEANRINVLTRDTYYQAYDRLQKALPPPLTDDPEDLERRDNRAMAELASLVPVNAAEVKLAVLFVGTSSHAEMVLGTETHDEESARKVRAQAANMMRQAFSGLSLLIRLQAVRAKREASNTATDAAAWTEYIALDHMAQARRRSMERQAEAGPADPSDGSCSETLSQSSASETPMRRDSSAFASDDETLDNVARPAVSIFETESHLSGNETPMRLGNRVSTIDNPPDSLGSGSALPWPPPDVQPGMETAAPLHRPPEAEGLIRSASG